MKSANPDQILSAVFVDYDNIYLSLKRKNEEAARRFARDTPRWIAAIQSGELITPNNANVPQKPRRTVMNRCYGNPVPRRNASDNKTDMESFPFIRHHFLRAGFEIIDCPPLTAQLKNSSDIKMVMDLRDFLTHETYFNEFVILSSDADFTPVLHRLRAHNRTTTIFVNDNTAAPYTAIADAEIREDDLIALLLGSAVEAEIAPQIASEVAAVGNTPAKPNLTIIAGRIIDVVADAVRQAPAPLPLEAAAERATRMLGAELTTDTQWAGAGGFLELLKTGLPDDIRLSGQTPPVLFDKSRVVSQSIPQLPAEAAMAAAAAAEAEAAQLKAEREAAEAEERAIEAAKAELEAKRLREEQEAAQRAEAEAAQKAAEEEAAALAAQKAKVAAEIQQSIAKIHEASQAPPLSPPEYAILFQELASEISENDLQGVQTLSNVEKRLEGKGVDIRREDIRFVLGVVSEQDPWFEQGASTSMFAGRFRNFVVARCRSQDLPLSQNELELIETWFAGSIQTPPPARPTLPPRQETPAAAPSTDDWWENDAAAQSAAAGDGSIEQKLSADDALPRMLRS